MVMPAAASASKGRADGTTTPASMVAMDPSSRSRLLLLLVARVWAVVGQTGVRS